MNRPVSEIVNCPQCGTRLDSVYDTLYIWHCGTCQISYKEDDIDIYKAARDILTAKVERLRKALEVYADLLNWRDEPIYPNLHSYRWNGLLAPWEVAGSALVESDQ